MDFKSLQEQLRTPDLLITDYAKFDRPPQIWLAIRAMHQFFSTVCTMRTARLFCMT